MTTTAVRLALTRFDAESGLANLADLARGCQRVDAWQAPADKILKISRRNVDLFLDDMLHSFLKVSKADFTFLSNYEA